jgi:diguanylate cyclase (GGDEF)-like protein/PAS domain S-box-containing protein
VSKEERVAIETAPAAHGSDGVALCAPLNVTEEHYASLVAAMPGIAFRRVMDTAGAIHYPYFTESVYDILGFKPAGMKVSARGCLHVVHWADRDSHVGGIRRSAASMQSCVEEFRAVSATGEVRYLRGVSKPRPGLNGNIVWDGVLIDATSGRRAELRFDLLMEHGADSIFIITEDGLIDAANVAAQRLFGYVSAELRGRPFQMLLAGIIDGVEVLNHESHASILGGTRELVGLRKDGSTFPLELSADEVRLEGHRLFVGIGRDITKRKRTEAALQATEQRLRAIAANMPGMVFQRVLRPDGKLEYSYVSEGSRAVLGLEPEDLAANPQLFLDALSPEERQHFLKLLGRSARTMEPFEEEMSLTDGTGRRRWLRGQSRPTLLPSGDVVWDGVLLDVSDRKVAEQRLSFLAYYDPLTQLPNRAAFIERFDVARHTARQNHTLVGVVSVGVDRFGIINATMGHAVGDAVLIAAAETLQAALGPDDVIARASGDRFLIFIAGHAGRRDLVEAVERIHAIAQTTVEVAGEQINLAASVGVAIYPRDGEEPETLLRNADAALQLAKGQGPATLQFFTSEMGARASKTLSLQTKLRRALDNNEFVPFFQPQVDLVHGGIVGMEALVRWMAPEGMISPVEFIPVAEESGLIDAICEVMLGACARQNKDWQNQGLPCIPVAVNVSGRQFQYARRLMTALETVLTDTGLDPRYLEIELTESSAMRDADNAIAVVQKVRDMGISCAIDDFGTGYSSLSVLKRFPIHKLKIDRSFVMDVVTDPNDAAIVDAIVAMAKALNLKVVAEGVEHLEHLEFLRSVGCDQMQGYYFSRPLAADKMGELLREGRRLNLSPRADLVI